MSNNINGSGISFWQLIEKNKIEIPLIQRDYAQGRDDEKTKKIRSKFLFSIINTLEKENFPLELDFVYGNVKNNILQPLDGQQRLTTLFLLHWVLAIRINNLSQNESIFLKFTYETRISSREFCNGLVKNWNDLGEGETLSEKISDSKWFFLSWKKDPTIKAMLTMLDALDEILKDKKTNELNIFWQKLTHENSVITFNFKELNDVGLTDDLYIKMNARGKALTEFENFKAQFEKYIKESNPDKTDWEVEYKDKPTETFSHKIDTIWTDLFWKYRGNDNLIDNEFIKFISGIAINNYAQNLEIIEHKGEEGKIRAELETKSNGKPVSKDAVKRERIERKIQLLFNSPDEISPIDFPTKKAFDYLVSSLDNYSIDSNNEIIPSDLPLWDYCKKGQIEINNITKIENNLFIEFIKNSETTYKQRVLFFAQTQYLLSSNEFNQESFSHWMRVIRNIVENSTINNASTLISAINLIQELSSGCLNIYEYLTLNVVKAKHAELQVKEEIEKAKIINSDFDSKQVIQDTEDTNFCAGRIDFALFCIDYEVSDKSESKIFEKEKLREILHVIKTYFPDLRAKLPDSFKRAFLTVGDNNYYDVWGTWSFSFECQKRWLLNICSDLKEFSHSRDWKRNYLKKIFKSLVNNSFNKIIDNFVNSSNFIALPKWKQRIIKEAGLLKNATFILIPNDNSYCKLAWQQKPSKEDQIKKIN
ncbi:MAG: hypothetical protein CFE24_15225 [Flavobacterium sp. BFFFF2]|nr:MAG: hypothetical protein CFE24_15225 [Flavobacterium sp. BFFFF2]